jgi:hypothetical protein
MPAPWIIEAIDVFKHGCFRAATRQMVLLRYNLSITPRQQLINTIDLVLRDAGENVGQPGLRIDTV